MPALLFFLNISGRVEDDFIVLTCPSFATGIEAIC
jgi:hypothetical protein